MRFIDLNRLIKGQEIPRIQYRPLKVMEDRIYVEKIMEGLDRYWADGIYRYDLATEVLRRVDQGIQVKYPSRYEMDLPSSYEDVMAMESMGEIYYCLKQEAMDTVSLHFFAVNIHEDSQREVLHYEYYEDEYDYQGMEILSEGYFIFTLAPRYGDERGLEHERVYLVDVEEGVRYPVKDIPFRISGGKREVIGNQRPYLFLEEAYLSEGEELEFLLSDDVELVMKVPEDMDESFVYINRLNVLPLENFIRLVKVGAHRYKYQVLDEMLEEGVLRTVGETRQSIYYKKARHDHLLRASKEFTDRIMIGKEEIYAMDKETMTITKVMDMEEDSILAFEEDGVYEIREDLEKIDIYQPDPRKMIAGQPEKILRFSYQKQIDPKNFKEYFYDLFGHRYLAIGVISAKESDIKSHLRIVDLHKKEPDIRCRDLYVVGETVFYG